MKSLSVTFWYGVLSLGFVIVLIFEISFFSSKVQSIQTNTTSLKNDISTMQARLATLQSARPKITDGINKTTEALPSDNSALLVTSQIRHLALDNQVEIKNINLTSNQLPKDGSVGTMQVNFTLNGNTSNVLVFLDKIINASPLLYFDSISILSNESLSIGQIAINSFWAPLPTELPSLSDPLVALSGEEEMLLEKINTLESPVLTTAETSTTSGQIKSDPFSPI